ncbi:BMP family lipoprotein [Longirhabdus pacifica]|uniref:BMP family lipoprotein n=1 Tax=Longirhabdus pacifica TaxID=2305227 RepID=UPI001008C278|nr:BMP family protein [Longirhabdus pacifica]
MKKFLLTLSALMLVFSVVLAGCGQAEDEEDMNDTNGSGDMEEDATEENKGASDISFGMVTDVGGVDDKSFNQSAWEGLNKLEADLGTAEPKYLQSDSDADYIPHLNKMIKDKDLTWGIGFNMADAIIETAERNPDAKLAIIDNEIKDIPNIVSVTFSENEGAYLVGVVAGLTTNTNKIGFVGGVDIPVIKNFELGFLEGVKAVNPEAEVEKNYTGAFDKADLGKNAAATMFDSGVDIIFHAAGGTGNGVFTEAKERKANGQDVWVIGVDKDQSIEFGNEVTLTSMIKKVDEAVYQVSADLVEGKYEGGSHIVLGLKENGVGLPEENPNITDEILAQVEEYKEKIVSGEITVPSAYE